MNLPSLAQIVQIKWFNFRQLILPRSKEFDCLRLKLWLCNLLTELINMNLKGGDCQLTKKFYSQDKRTTCSPILFSALYRLRRCLEKN